MVQNSLFCDTGSHGGLELQLQTSSDPRRSSYQCVLFSCMIGPHRSDSCLVVPASFWDIAVNPLLPRSHEMGLHSLEILLDRQLRSDRVNCWHRFLVSFETLCILKEHITFLSYVFHSDTNAYEQLPPHVWTATFHVRILWAVTLLLVLM